MSIEPYYQSERVTLYCGECRAVLREEPGLRCDALIADPPYSSGGLFRGDRMQSVVDKYCQSGNDRGRAGFTGDNRDQRSWITWTSIWLEEFRKCLPDGGYLLCFSDWRMLPAATDSIQFAGYIWRGTVAWNKGRGARAPHKGYFRHQCEYILWGTNGHCAAAEHDGPYDGCYDVPVLQGDKHHITGKPTKLLRELVRIVPENATILDPFCGSGTTGVAAIQLGRKFIGIELEERYCEIAAKRIQEAEQSQPLFTEGAA